MKCLGSSHRQCPMPLTVARLLAPLPRRDEGATPNSAANHSGLRLLGLILGPRKWIVARPVGRRPAEPHHLGIQLEPVVAPADGEPTVVAVAIGRPIFASTRPPTGCRTSSRVCVLEIVLARRKVQHDVPCHRQDRRPRGRTGHPHQGLAASHYPRKQSLVRLADRPPRCRDDRRPACPRSSTVPSTTTPPSRTENPKRAPHSSTSSHQPLRHLMNSSG